MSQPLLYLTSKIMVINSISNSTDLIIDVLFELLKKLPDSKKIGKGYQIRARKGYIYDPQLIEVNIFPKKDLEQLTVIQVSCGMPFRGFGDKAIELTKNVLKNNIQEFLNLIIPNLTLIGIDQNNVCLNCGKINNSKVVTCEKCHSKLDHSIQDLGLKEISSLEEEVGIYAEEPSSKIFKKEHVTNLMKQITPLVEGKAKPASLEDKEEPVSSFKIGHCVNCNWTIDKKTLILFGKGFKIRCPNCDEPLE